MSDYRNHAYERCIVEELQRILIDRFVASDAPPRQTLVCEEAIRSESDVPQEAFLRVLEKLQVWENHERSKMSQYHWRREEPQPPYVTPTVTSPHAKKNETTPATSSKHVRKRKVSAHS